MNSKTAFLGLIGSLVVAASAHAETPLFASGATPSVLGHSSDWTSVSFSALSSQHPAPLIFSLISEQTSAAATQTFSVNGNTIFAGSATTGAMVSSASPISISSFAFNSHIGGSHFVSTQVGNTPNVDHSGEYLIYESKSVPTTFAIAYEDDFRTRGVSGDYNDMVVRVSVAPVPEPETYALMAAGLGALVLVGRRRRAD